MKTDSAQQMSNTDSSQQVHDIEMANFEIVEEHQHVSSMFKIVEELAADNIDYFEINEKGNHTDFVHSFETIHTLVSPLNISLDLIIASCAKFDINPHCKGNGYRSIVTIVECCLSQIIRISEQVQRNRDKLFFRSYQMYAELESYAQLLARLLTIVQFAIILLENSEGGWLFPKDTPKVHGMIADLMSDFDNINRDCFYGRTFGFQYEPTIRHTLQVIAVAMAAYGDGYIRHTDTLSRAVSSVIHSGKYVIDPDLRAKRIAELSKEVDINFCKAFWSLTEEYGVQHAPLLVCPAMDVNLEFTIPSDDLNITSLSGTNTVVKFPSLAGLDGVKARLLSSVWRDGQIHNVWKKNTSYGPLGPKPRQRSKYLMFHCHGGGFVAQSSKSHEMYLRYWAKELRIPIISIDYTLSPEAVFPQALNEIFFAYVWALNNFKKLGTTGEKIVFTGDSAGANLVTAALFKCIKHNIRLPDSLVVAYPPYRVQFYPSPSRILCLMDPLLPVGVLKSCILAYVGSLESDKTPSKKHDSLQAATHLYNPFELDLGQDHWDVRHLHNCGQYHSLSETNLDMIKSQLDPVHGYSDDEEYFSDGPLSDLENCSSSDLGKIKRSGSYGDVLKKASSSELSTEVLPAKKGCADLQSSASGSLLQSLKSQVSLHVYDFTTRVSSKVFDDIKSSVTQQIPSDVLDASSKVFNDIRTGVTDYFSSQSAVDVKKHEPDQDRQGVDFVVGSECTSRKRALKSVSRSEPQFSICKDCLYPSFNCNCNMAWSGKIVPQQKQVLTRYGSRHRLQKRSQRSITGSNFKCLHVHDTPPKNTSCIECNEEDCSYTHSDAPSTSSKDVQRPSLNSGGSIISSFNSLGQTSVVKEDSSNVCVDDVTTVDMESPGFSGATSFDRCKMPKQFSTVLSTLDSTGSSSPSSSTRSVRSNLINEVSNDMTSDMLDPNDIDMESRDFRNPFMSPIFASKELLLKMPPVAILACSLDPLFDDSVDFIRKLQELNKEAELYVLDQLPHGFLNFHVFSSEAHEACDLMIACIKKSLNMGTGRNDSFASFPVT